MCKNVIKSEFILRFSYEVQTCSFALHVNLLRLDTHDILSGFYLITLLKGSDSVSGICSKMVRKLKFHEKKLLKKVDFISWELDNNIHEAKILRKYHIKKRQHYSMYNTLAAHVSLCILWFCSLNKSKGQWKLLTVMNFF